jgi:hypothetical protein
MKKLLLLLKKIVKNIIFLREDNGKYYINDYDTYNGNCIEITKEEYDFLKELEEEPIEKTNPNGDK